LSHKKGLVSFLQGKQQAPAGKQKNLNPFSLSHKKGLVSFLQGKQQAPAGKQKNLNPYCFI
jgi:hypothetical protein